MHRSRRSRGFLRKTELRDVILLLFGLAPPLHGGRFSGGMSMLSFFFLFDRLARLSHHVHFCRTIVPSAFPCGLDHAGLTENDQSGCRVAPSEQSQVLFRLTFEGQGSRELAPAAAVGGDLSMSMPFPPAALGRQGEVVSSHLWPGAISFPCRIWWSQLLQRARGRPTGQQCVSTLQTCGSWEEKNLVCCSRLHPERRRRLRGCAARAGVTKMSFSSLSSDMKRMEVASSSSP